MSLEVPSNLVFCDSIKLGHSISSVDHDLEILVKRDRILCSAALFGGRIKYFCL